MRCDCDICVGERAAEKRRRWDRIETAGLLLALIAIALICVSAG